MKTDTPLAEHLAAAVRARLAHLGRAQRWLAKEIGVDAPNLSRMLAGTSLVKLDTLTKIAAALGTTVGDLLGGRADQFALPLCGWIPGGKAADPSAAADTTNFNEMFEGGTFTLDVRGESMCGAGVFDNDTVVLRQAETADDGDIVAVVVNGERTLKLMGKDSQGRPALLSFNDEFPPILLRDGDDVKIEGVVIGGAWTVKRRRWKPKPVRGRLAAPKGKKK